jgi:hypothetical protein
MTSVLGKINRGGAVVQAAARGLLLAILVYAPWAYGSTRLWTMEILNAACWACLALHLLGLALERRTPGWPLGPVACLAVLLAESGWMFFNAHSYHDAAFLEFVPLLPPFPALPGSWDRAATFFYLQRQLAMAAIFLVAADTVRHLPWKRGVRVTMAVTGVSVAIYGLVQRAFNAPSIFWLPEDTGATFFGAYRYHANAGAFLNLVWPVLLLGTIRSFWAHRADFSRTAWSAGLFLMLVGCAVNVSRAASGLTLLLLLFAGAALWPLLRRRGAYFPFWKIVLGGTVALVFFGTIFVDGVASETGSRWKILGHQLGDGNYQRFLTYEACLRTAPDAGWFGYGAGTFSAVFPDHSAYLGDRLTGFWKFAHEDYLQTVIEYGYAGAFLWGALLFGSIGRALFRACDRTLRTGDRLDYIICVIALVGVALHSLVDFPLQIASIQLYVMIFFALAWADPVGEPRNDHDYRRKPVAAGLPRTSVVER